MYVSRIIGIAQPLYPRNKAYHNFGHAIEVWKSCQKLIARCRAYGLDPDEEVLAWAAFFHDALFGLGYQVKGFATMEEMSANAAIEEMRKAGLNPNKIALAADAIKATHYSLEPQTLEAKILRAADMSNLGGSNEGYREAAERLMAELNISDRLRYFLGSSRLLAHYLHWRIEVTPEYHDDQGRSAWHLGALSNMLANYFESCYEAGIEPAVVMDLDPLPLPAARVYPDCNALILGMDPDDCTRRQALMQADPLSSQELPVELMLPGASFCAPLPGSSVDTFSLTEPALIRLDTATKNEMARVAAKKHTPLHLKC